MKNKALKVLFLYNGIFVGAAAMLGPLYAIYVEKFVDGVMAVSISWAAFLISTLVFTYIISKMGDIVSEKEYLLIAGYGVRILSWILLIFTHNLLLLIFIQILLGFGESLGTPSFRSLVAQHLDKDKYIKDYSSLLIIDQLASVIGILVGGVIVTWFGFKILFLVMAMLSLIPFLAILSKPRKLL